MRLASVWTMIAVLSAVSTSGQTASVGGAPSPPKSATTPARKQEPRNPYSRLFQVPRPVTPSPAEVQAGPPKQAPIIKCGMTLIPADPRIDPDIAHTPHDRTTNFTIRAIEPPVCK